MIRSPTYGQADSDDTQEWRRGRVKRVDADTDTINVFLVDEGFEWSNQTCENIIPIGTNYTRQLTNEKFMYVEPQARLCRLKNAWPSNGSRVWSHAANSVFKRLIDQVGIRVTSCERVDMSGGGGVSGEDFEYGFEVEVSVK